MLDLISIGSQIAERRKKLKLSQTDLSRKAGLSRPTLDELLQEDRNDKLEGGQSWPQPPFEAAGPADSRSAG
jgi:hypothetical protein